LAIHAEKNATDCLYWESHILWAALFFSRSNDKKSSNHRGQILIVDIHSSASKVNITDYLAQNITSQVDALQPFEKKRIVQMFFAEGDQPVVAVEQIGADVVVAIDIVARLTSRSFLHLSIIPAPESHQESQHFQHLGRQSHSDDCRELSDGNNGKYENYQRLFPHDSYNSYSSYHFGFLFSLLSPFTPLPIPLL
jgi:hypothetical protein